MFCWKFMKGGYPKNICRCPYYVTLIGGLLSLEDEIPCEILMVPNILEYSSTSESTTSADTTITNSQFDHQKPVYHQKSIYLE